MGTGKPESTAAGAAVSAEASAQQAAASVDAHAAVPESARSREDRAEPGPNWVLVGVGSGITAALLGGTMILFTFSGNRVTDSGNLALNAGALVTEVEAEGGSCTGNALPEKCVQAASLQSEAMRLKSQGDTFQALGIATFAGAWIAGAITVAYGVWPRERESERERDNKREARRNVWVAPSFGPGTAGLVMQGRF